MATPVGPNNFPPITDAGSYANHQLVKGPAGASPASSGVYLYDSVLPPGVISTAYSQSLTGGGGTAPYTFALATGSALPTGLSLSASGTISGTPTATGTSSFSIMVTDANGNSATQPLSLTVNTATTPTTAASGYGFFT